MAQTTTKTRPASTAPKHDKPVTEENTNTVDVSEETGDVGVGPVVVPESIVDRIKQQIGGAAAVSQKVLQKQTTVQEIRQKLAEIADDASEVVELNEAVEEAAGDVTYRMYKARIEGLISADELSQILGDSFGFKKKGESTKRVPSGDKDASKTPFGQGENIRKRVVRMVNAWNIAEGKMRPEDDRLFADIPVEKVHEIVDAVEKIGEDGQRADDAMSLFTAFDNLTNLRRDNAPETVKPAFNAKKVADWAGSLTEAGAGEQIANNPDLVEAYMGLYEILTLFGFDEVLKARQANQEPEQEQA